MASPVRKLGNVSPAIATGTGVCVVGAELYLLPVHTRVPLKFGAETLNTVTCARVRLQVRDRAGRTAAGWGETPLSVQWAWPAELSWGERYEAMVGFCKELALSWTGFDSWGHPMEVGQDFIQVAFPGLRQKFNDGRDASHRLPLLAGLVCLSAFDIALHDAFGVLHGVPTYTTYNREWMSRDLSWYLEGAADADVDFRNLYPQDFFVPPPRRLAAWHLVGGLDPLDEGDLVGGRIADDFPSLLTEWIERDGLYCLKIKLRGNDAEWDYDRLIRVGRLAVSRGVRSLSADFNCTVTEPEYVNRVLDRLAREAPDVDRLLLYVEQPFPYELEQAAIDVRSVSARKPLFMDESAHSWQQIRLGRSLGWTGVALKTCKTQTGALLSLCWAKAHGMKLMVQDLTNPMLAQLPHVLLAAHAGTLLGVETNSMQFYPEASAKEARIHSGVFTRVNGQIDLSSLCGPGFGYNGAERARELPPPVASHRQGLGGGPHWNVRR